MKSGPLVVSTALEEGYRAMAADREREADALEWSNGSIEDVSGERLDQPDSGYGALKSRKKAVPEDFDPATLFKT